MIIYPNPTRNYFSIHDKNNLPDKNFTILVLDIQGKLIQQFILNKENTQIDISHLKKGIYFAKIETSIGVITKKIVKH